MRLLVLENLIEWDVPSVILWVGEGEAEEVGEEVEGEEVDDRQLKKPSSRTHSYLCRKSRYTTTEVVNSSLQLASKLCPLN